MNDDLNQKFKQFTDMLGKEGMPENLSGLLSLLASSGMKEPVPKQKEEPVFGEEKSIWKESPEKNEYQDNMEMMRKITGIMSNIQNINDPRINLLTAIRPFLSNSRQKKIGNCIKLFQMTYLTKLMSENEKIL